MVTENRIEDFPPGQFAIAAFCEACGHSAWLWRERIPAGINVRAIAPRLRCRRCGARGGEIRIIYAAGPVYHHRGTTVVAAHSEEHSASSDLALGDGS